MNKRKTLFGCEVEAKGRTAMFDVNASKPSRLFSRTCDEEQRRTC